MDLDSAAEIDRLRRRVDREHRSRLEAEAIAERTTGSLYATVQELDRMSQRIGLLQRTTAAANEATTVEEAAQVAVDEICAFTGWPVGHLYVRDPDGSLSPTKVWHLADAQRFAAFRRVTERTPMQPGEGLPGRVAASGRPEWIEDVRRDASFIRANADGDIRVHAGIGLPVTTDHGVMAVLEFFTEEAVLVDDLLLETLAEAAAQIGRVAERRRAHDALEASEERNRLIVETANDAFVAIDSASLILEWNRNAERLFGWTKEEVVGRPLTDTIIPPEHRDAHMAGLAHFLATGEGAVIGRRVEFTAIDRQGRQFPVDLTPWALTVDGEWRFNAFINDVTERKQLERRLEHLALHDSLTGLANRALLMDRMQTALARAMRNESPIAVLFLDLDRFKIVNDSLGHQAGDDLLLMVAARLREATRDEDTLARLGGDEFVLLCESPMSLEDAQATAKRIQEAMEAPFVLADTEVAVTASVGLLLTSATADALTILADADLAMYRAKEKGKGIVEVFDASMRTQIVGRLEIEHALRQALDKGELVVYYQPVWDLRARRLSGVEALVRWDRPGVGLVGPMEFIHVAEETGLIGALGEAVLGQAARQEREWVGAHGSDAPHCVQVNLSLRQLEQPGFADRVAGILEGAGLAPERVMLEITESVFVTDTAATARTLWELREIGVKFAIDDFGTGYSSLDRLRRLPVDQLKIDRSFVAELDTESGLSLVGAIVAMAHSLGLVVVAEGVETELQLGLLQRLDCDEAQGYLLCEPRAAAAIEPFFGAPPVALTAAPVVPDDELARTLSLALGRGGALDPRARSLLAELRRLLANT